MHWFEIDINSRNPVADRLRAVACDLEAPAGYAFYFGSWLDPEAACELFDRMADVEALEWRDEEQTQPGGEAFPGLPPLRRAP